MTSGRRPEHDQRPSGVRLVALHAGLPQELPAVGPGKFEQAWRTGIFKHPVAQPRWLARTNLEGDGQADIQVHGGPDKAVLAYPGDHYPAWQGELNLPQFGPGAFGENLTLSGLDEWTVSLGDTFRVGDAVIEISQPRGPCWKLARRWSLPDLPARVLKSGRTGWYFRVLEEGMVGPRAEVRPLERPAPEWTIDRVNRVSYGKEAPRSELAELSRSPWLAQGWRTWAAERSAAAG